MQPFVRHEGVAAPVLVDNVDTDQIIPSREMNRITKHGLGEGLFAGWRYLYDGARKTGPNPDFVLNDPAYSGTSILLGGRNFGCGSSREHAVWALGDFGIRAIIAESFGRIFYNNCARNGLLAVELPAAEIGTLVRQVADDPGGSRIGIDLEAQTIEGPDGTVYAFDVAPSDREMLLNGLDHIEYTLQFEDEILKFTADDREARPWAYLSTIAKNAP